MAIFFSSDLHFNHDRDFIYTPRGFTNVHEMNKAILERFHAKVGPDDDLYLLGDVILGDNEEGIKFVHQLPGKIHLVYGNHDTDSRKSLLSDSWNVVEILNYATIIKAGKWRFYLSHYPTLTANFDDNKKHLPLMNLYGHTHQKTNFFNDNPYMYHVGVDSHDCYPVSLEEIKEDIRGKVNE